MGPDIDDASASREAGEYAGVQLRASGVFRMVSADELEKLPAALRLARRVMRIVHQNVALSLAAIAVRVTAGRAGQLSHPEALLLNEGTALLITANGLRLLRSPP